MSAINFQTVIVEDFEARRRLSWRKDCRECHLPIPIRMISHLFHGQLDLRRFVPHLLLLGHQKQGQMSLSEPEMETNDRHRFSKNKSGGDQGRKWTEIVVRLFGFKSSFNELLSHWAFHQVSKHCDHNPNCSWKLNNTEPLSVRNPLAWLGTTKQITSMGIRSLGSHRVLLLVLHPQELFQYWFAPKADEIKTKGDPSFGVH